MSIEIKFNEFDYDSIEINKKDLSITIFNNDAEMYDIDKFLIIKFETKESFDKFINDFKNIKIE